MHVSASDPAVRLDALHTRVRAIESLGRTRGQNHCPFEIEDVDCRLGGGGLAAGALHEAAGAGTGLGDYSAATLFIASIAARRARKDGQVLWAGRRDLFAPGLAQAGLAPNNLIYAECGRDEDALAVMEEGLRHGGLAAVIGEIGAAAMTSTRRLQLAAEGSGTTALMLRRWRKAGQDPLAIPSAAMTRWRIGCVPSGELPFEGVGRPRWRVELARQRGGGTFTWIMEGPDAEGSLALPARPSHRSAAADRGEERRAA